MAREASWSPCVDGLHWRWMYPSPCRGGLREEVGVEEGAGVDAEAVAVG